MFHLTLDYIDTKKLNLRIRSGETYSSTQHPLTGQVVTGDEFQKMRRLIQTKCIMMRDRLYVAKL